MNKDENKGEDLLRQFLNPAMVEKVPEGFTSKVMTRMQMEPRPAKSSFSRRERSAVPWVSAAVIVLLIFSSFLLAPGTDLLSSSLFNMISDIEISIPSFELPELGFPSLPGWIPYMIAGIAFLSLFDRALNGLFHRKEK